MVVVKLLERKSVIRLFGVALVLAPFFNILMSMSLQTNIANRWTMKIFLKIISTSYTFDHILYVASFLIGLIMLSGSMAAWRWVLFLLGGVIANQTMNLGQNFRSNWMSIPFFIVNVSIFLFILDQLAWKQKKPATEKKSVSKAATVAPKLEPAKSGAHEKAPLLKTGLEPALASASLSPVLPPIPTSIKETSTPHSVVVPIQAPALATAPAPALASQLKEPKSVQRPSVVASAKTPDPQPIPQKLFQAPRPSSFQTQKKVLVHFAGIGAWAQVMSISKEGLHVRSLKQPPADIHSRAIEISLKNGLHLQMRLNRQAGDDFYFGYSNLTSNDIRLLNQWLQQVA